MKQKDIRIPTGYLPRQKPLGCFSSLPPKKSRRHNAHPFCILLFRGGSRSLLHPFSNLSCSWSVYWNLLQQGTFKAAFPWDLNRMAVHSSVWLQIFRKPRRGPEVKATHPHFTTNRSRSPFESKSLPQKLL